MIKSNYCRARTWIIIISRRHENTAAVICFMQGFFCNTLFQLLSVAPCLLGQVPTWQWGVLCEWMSTCWGTTLLRPWLTQGNLQPQVREIGSYFLFVGMIWWEFRTTDLKTSDTSPTMPQPQIAVGDLVKDIDAWRSELITFETAT